MDCIHKINEYKVISGSLYYYQKGGYIMNNRVKCFLSILIIVTLFFTGCDIIRNLSEKKMSGSFTLLSDTKSRAFDLEEGDTITIEYDIKLKSGSLSAEFVDSLGNVIVDFEPDTSDEIDIDIDEDDTYELVIVANEAKGSYDFEFEIN